ncbi:MAG: hypothetical protein JSR73_11860 [Proteobacteria bacterium]|nr:hypothetical protein [Pseudomonadota bacterium]
MALSAGVVNVPLVAFVPLQPPEAVQLVALVELQVSTDVWPLAIEVGFAESAAVGAGGAPTVTMTDCCALPPAPEQLRVYVVVVVSVPVDIEPLVVCVPVQPPEAVQLVALVELHVSIDVAP